MTEKPDTLLKKVDRVIHHPVLKKVMDISNSVLDVAFKLGQARNNPLLYVPAFASILGAVSKATGDGRGDTYKIIEALDLNAYTGSLGGIIAESEIFYQLEPLIASRGEDNLVLWKIPVEKGFVYIHKYSNSASDGTIYYANGQKYLIDLLIKRCFELVGGMGVELTNASKTGTMVMRPIAPVFTDHPLDKVLQLTNAIHTIRSRNESPAWIFYGPPGTGKSTLAISVAELMNMKVLMMGPQAIERVVGKTFIDVITALKPDMIILDDIDKAHTQNVFYTGLNHIRAVLPQITVIVTTNSPAKLGNAFLRPGRGGELMAFVPPTLEEKKEILVKVGANYIDEMAPVIHPRCTHDWVSHLGKKLSRVVSLEQALELTKDQNQKFQITENVKDPAPSSVSFDDGDDDV